MTITDQRVVFQGPKQVREWPFAKMLGVVHAKDAHITVFQVSGRSKSSGIEYPRGEEHQIRAALHQAAEAFDARDGALVAESPSTHEVGPAHEDEARLTQLERLGQLRDSGVLNDAEFNEEKARLLGKEPTRAPTGPGMAQRAVTAGAQGIAAVGKAGLAKVKEARAQAEPGRGAAIPPAEAWHPDPAGRHELRWWDGQSWTAHVSDGGEASLDDLREGRDHSSESGN